ncbi:ABC transporter permease [Cesiribacter andamanensis]|uniref:Macrolide export ATP-binding/permease protein MacB n=1 Tax=Cesiribacter andamanensis AMV16 TaxID=1279009 RepID=M7N0N3_9BACT|nr:FtsX-like permease family protein [Cesiribacter andamanensis]EMR00867.1 Macrolide export ATP-binding/permease protein MacB [Cesiribacter andamanensis AMV16]
MNFPWLLRMAWRDSRRNRSRLLLFMSSIVLGIAALVAINSFGDNLQQQIDTEAKKLLGADLELESPEPFSPEIRQFFDSLGAEASEEVRFASMVLFPKNGGSRLVQVRALGGRYPYYGEIETAPAGASRSFQVQQTALADQTLLLQYNARPGDSIKVGNTTFLIQGSVLKVPGQAGFSTTVAPPVFIPLSQLEATGLLQKGSRIERKLYLRFDESQNFSSLYATTIKPRLEKAELRHDTADERQQEIGDAYSDLTGFLNLVAFVALLLGCIGVASSVHIYIKDKVISVAILRCLGVSGRQALAIYLIQISLMGLIGAVLGTLLGMAVLYGLPGLFADFLPVEVAVTPSLRAIVQGVLVGLVVSVLFALLPLLGIRRVSPLTALRASFEADGGDKLRYGVFTLILLFIWAFSWLQLQDPLRALVFTGGVLLALLVLAGIAQGMIWAVRRFFPTGWAYIWRQSLANLYRPNNQTLVLVITIGLGTALISTLFFVQHSLLEKVALTGSDNQPNMVVFDIQDDQVEAVATLTRQQGLPVLQQVPVVTMRLEGIGDRSVEQIKQDTTSGIRRWVLNREYRVTYRDSLIDSETLLEGRWRGSVASPRDSVFISLSQNLAEDMKVGLGDKISFNVQGAIMDTWVGSIREVDWQRVQTNFLVVFPAGVLERAPQFHVLITRVDSVQQAAAYQRAVVQRYPNVSLIDLNLILQTIDDILGRVSFVIRFMAFFSIITGLVVLIGSVIISKYQRIQESVLLRTLGASRRQILSINTLEYFFLGSLAALTGMLIALLSSWALAYFSFDTPFSPPLWPILIAYVSITGLTILIGLSNSRAVVNKPPLEILRTEV